MARLVHADRKITVTNNCFTAEVCRQRNSTATRQANQNFTAGGTRSQSSRAALR